jgi:Branched-chain amino acid transport protein (AzlD)
MSTELNAYVLLVLVGFLPNEVWRMIGLAFARRIDESSELFMWARAVATAVLAGVIAKILLFPPGALANVTLLVRVGAIACGLAAFLLLRRSIFAAVVVGEVVLTLGVLLGDWV